MSSQTFADLGVSGAVSGALARRGIDAPFAIQELVIADVLAGRDVLAKSPTGSGKTLAFGIPLVERTAQGGQRPSALVLAPTRELATQIVDELQTIASARNLKIAAVYGGVGLEKQSREAARANIIVATPGRLEDLLQRRAFTLANVGMLVLDEADRMLDMGFRPAVDRIVGACPKDRQTLFFSATLDGEAGKIANVYTRDAARHEHVATERKAAAIDHAFVAIERDDRLTALEGALRSPGRDLALVFVRTKRGADRLVKRLASSGVEAVAMHGDKSQRQRERALSSFESGKVNVLVATDVAARGIDVADISHVINFDPPEDRETYVHRTGRTGRAGRTGAAVTFVGIEQVRDVGKIAQELGLTAAFEQAGLSAGRHGGGGGRPAHATGNTAERRNHPRPARRQEQRPRHTSGSDGEAPRGSRQRAGRQRTRREGGTR